MREINDTADLNRFIKQSADIDTNEISDGYHTFGELYEHRITLFIALLRQKLKEADMLGEPFTAQEREIWRSKKHSDGSEWEGWFLLGINKQPGRQITYHLPISKWEECGFAETLERAPEWDGHTTADVLDRLKGGI